jgi:hypothetical protein
VPATSSRRPFEIATWVPLWVMVAAASAVVQAGHRPPGPRHRRPITTCAPACQGAAAHLSFVIGEGSLVRVT